MHLVIRKKNVFNRKLNEEMFWIEKIVYCEKFMSLPYSPIHFYMIVRFERESSPPGGGGRRGGGGRG